MNKEYIQSGENFIISTDSGLKKVERINNMTKILETENNIEEIEYLKRKSNEKVLFNFQKIRDYVDGKFFIKFFCVAFPLVAISTIATAIISNIDMAVAVLLMSLGATGITLISSTPIQMNACHKINKNIYENADTLLNDELEKQKQKMEELEKESKVLAKNDLGILGYTIQIKRTKLIEDLKRKLELIEFYQLKKKDLMKYSKDGFAAIHLRNLGYSESDAEFILMLMKQDIEEKEKAKTLKLEKK